MNPRLRIYRVVVFVLAAVSVVCALDIHITNMIDDFYFPDAPVHDNTWFVDGLAALALILAIEGIVVLLPKALGWKR